MSDLEAELVPYKFLRTSYNTDAYDVSHDDTIVTEREGKSGALFLSRPVGRLHRLILKIGKSKSENPLMITFTTCSIENIKSDAKHLLQSCDETCGSRVKVSSSSITEGRRFVAPKLKEGSMVTIVREDDKSIEVEVDDPPYCRLWTIDAGTDDQVMACLSLGSAMSAKSVTIVPDAVRLLDLYKKMHAVRIQQHSNLAGVSFPDLAILDFLSTTMRMRELKEEIEVLKSLLQNRETPHGERIQSVMAQAEVTNRTFGEMFRALETKQSPDYDERLDCLSNKIREQEQQIGQLVQQMAKAGEGPTTATRGTQTTSHGSWVNRLSCWRL